MGGGAWQNRRYPQPHHCQTFQADRLAHLQRISFDRNALSQTILHIDNIYRNKLSFGYYETVEKLSLKIKVEKPLIFKAFSAFILSSYFATNPMYSIALFLTVKFSGMQYKNNRRFITRYEKKAVYFQADIFIACILLRLL